MVKFNYIDSIILNGQTAWVVNKMSGMTKWLNELDAIIYGAKF